MFEPLLTIKQAAAIIGVVEATVKRWAKSGKLKVTRINSRGDMRFRQEDLEEYLKGLNEN